MTEYAPSELTGTKQYQELAAGFPIGKRFRSAEVMRVADANLKHLGHHHKADGRYRVYVFADQDPVASSAALEALGRWLLASDESPVVKFTPQGADLDAIFDIKVIYQQDYSTLNINEVPKIFRPNVGKFGLVDYEKVYAALGADDIFDRRQVSRSGAIVIVRPDMYVAHVMPLEAREELATFFDAVLLPQN